MEHFPVLYQEVLQGLSIRPEGVYLDCTFGRGGHSSGILNQLGPDGTLLAIDADEEAIQSEVANELKKDQRFRLYHGNFSRLDEIAALYGVDGKVDGILMDLGVSSPQLDAARRGFSFNRDGPLDMRMNQTSGRTAEEWLAQVDEKELVNVLFEYGEEKFARKIARSLIDTRQKHPLQTTLQLARVITQSLPHHERHKHPATRSFQAIRIAVNQELNALECGLKQSVNVLATGGRLVVISFHSLEDRIVKRFFKSESGKMHDPGRLPVVEADIAYGRLKLVTKPIKASATEIQSNPRARSAIMRIAEKR